MFTGESAFVLFEFFPAGVSLFQFAGDLFQARMVALEHIGRARGGMVTAEWRVRHCYCREMARGRSGAVDSQLRHAAAARLYGADAIAAVAGNAFPAVGHGVLDEDGCVQDIAEIATA
jgi:hypothetical protein